MKVTVKPLIAYCYAVNKEAKQEKALVLPGPIFPHRTALGEGQVDQLRPRDSFPCWGSPKQRLMPFYGPERRESRRARSGKVLSQRWKDIFKALLPPPDKILAEVLGKGLGSGLPYPQYTHKEASKWQHLGSECSYVQGHGLLAPESLIAILFKDFSVLTVHKVWCREGRFLQWDLPGKAFVIG